MQKLVQRIPNNNRKYSNISFIPTGTVSLKNNFEIARLIPIKKTVYKQNVYFLRFSDSFIYINNEEFK